MSQTLAKTKEKIPAIELVKLTGKDLILTEMAPLPRLETQVMKTPIGNPAFYTLAAE